MPELFKLLCEQIDTGLLWELFGGIHFHNTFEGAQAHFAGRLSGGTLSMEAGKPPGEQTKV
jgi:hypothetical protein